MEQSLILLWEEKNQLTFVTLIFLQTQDPMSTIPPQEKTGKTVVDSHNALSQWAWLNWIYLQLPATCYATTIGTLTLDKCTTPNPQQLYDARHMKRKVMGLEASMTDRAYLVFQWCANDIGPGSGSVDPQHMEFSGYMYGIGWSTGRWRPALPSVGFIDGGQPDTIWYWSIWSHPWCALVPLCVMVLKMRPSSPSATVLHTSETDEDWQHFMFQCQQKLPSSLDTLAQTDRFVVDEGHGDGFEEVVFFFFF